MLCIKIYDLWPAGVTHVCVNILLQRGRAFILGSRSSKLSQHVLLVTKAVIKPGFRARHSVRARFTLDDADHVSVQSRLYTSLRPPLSQRPARQQRKS